MTPPYRRLAQRIVKTLFINGSAGWLEVRKRDSVTCKDVEIGVWHKSTAEAEIERLIKNAMRTHKRKTK